MTPDWILVAGTLVFFVTTWATINFGYAIFRQLGAQDDAETASPPPTEKPAPAAETATVTLPEPTGTNADPGTTVEGVRTGAAAGATASTPEPNADVTGDRRSVAG